MSKVAIVTDSTNCLPPEFIQQYDIRVVKYHVIIEGKDYRDQIDITPAEFWKMFKNLKSLPTTSIPSPGEYDSVFTDLAKSTDNIVCITASRGFTGAYQSADEAREIVATKHPGLRIELIDSRNSVGALGWVVLEAARAAEDGKSLAEVAQVARDMVPRVKYLAAFDTLKYLIKGGRAPKSAVIGELFNVKPLIGIVNSTTGLVDSLGREKGKRNAMLKLVDLVKEYADTSKPLNVIVHYTNRMKDGEELKELVTSRHECAEVYLTDLTPVMTTHTGPAIGLSFYS